MDCSEQKALLEGTLKKYWGYSEFREHQYEAIDSLMKRQDCFLMMATGAGKSLIYQLPAIALADAHTPSCSIVVSPLIALMEDQVSSLKMVGISACLLGSSSTLEVEQMAMYGYYTVIYCTPEKAVLWAHGLKELKARRVITCLAIDESHCVSEWGHDFRPEYRRLAEIRDIIGHETPCIALTASATMRVQEDIIRSLRLNNPLVIRASLNRPNLKYIAKKRHTTADIAGVLVSQRKKQLAAHHTSDDSFLPYPVTLIYVNSRKACETIAKELVECNALQGIRVAYYHASLPTRERTLVLEAFLRDEVQVIVCTTAFGLGINKPDIRLIIHYGLPLSMEGYYQQTGRAGRDGEDSDCVLLWSPQDINNCFYLLTNNSARAGNNESKTEEIDEQLRVVMDYAKATHLRCRREYILAYFQEDYPYTTPFASCCDLCEQLLKPKINSLDTIVDASNEKLDLSYEVFSLLYTIYLLQPVSYGLNMYIDILLGRHYKTVIEKVGGQYASLPTFSKGKHFGVDWWKALAGELAEGEGKYIQSNKMRNSLGYTYTTYSLTENGKKYVLGKDKEEVRLEGKEKEDKKTGLSALDTSHSKGEVKNLYDLLMQPTPSKNHSNSQTKTKTTVSYDIRGIKYDEDSHKVELTLSKSFYKVHKAIQSIHQPSTSASVSAPTTSASALPAPPKEPPSSHFPPPSGKAGLEAELLRMRNTYAQSCQLLPYHICTTAELSEVVRSLEEGREYGGIEEYIEDRYRGVEVKKWKKDFFVQISKYMQERQGRNREQKKEKESSFLPTPLPPTSLPPVVSASAHSNHVPTSSIQMVEKRPKVELYIPQYHSVPPASPPLQRSQSCPLPSSSQGSKGDDLLSYLADYIPRNSTGSREEKGEDEMEMRESEKGCEGVRIVDEEGGVSEVKEEVEREVVKAKKKRPQFFQIGGLRLKTKTC